jgi:DNA mismatch repair protein MutS2
MNDKTLHTLELPKILAALSRHTSFSLSNELALGLRPRTDLDGVRRAQAETAEARRLLELRPDVTVGVARDVRSAVARAELGGVIEPQDLLDVAATAVSGRTLRRVVVKLHEAHDELPLLARYADGLHDLPELEARVRGAIGESGDVLDSASPALARVRSELRVAQDRLQSYLRSVLTSSTYGQAIQEPIITQREGRYVIPVKASFRGRLPGIVHDTSASGQTLFVEPLGAVELGNRVRELGRKQAEEIERVLRELTALVAGRAWELRSTVEALGELDLALAKARYAGRMGGMRPEMVAVDDLPRDEPLIRLPQARHPLLSGRVVPTSLELGGPARILVITGPNTGGKTVALKTLGLLCLMAQCGLQTPSAPGTRLPVLTSIWADIGDEQSIEQSLSTFSSHISNIVGMLPRVGPDTLVLLDEIGAGTDPEEGSALARAVIDYLLERRCLAVVTTHYSDLKSYAHSTPGARNASVEFDEETLSPTYRLVVGLPGKSNALTIASRLGMPPEVIERAQERVRPQSRELNDLLQQIQDERDAASAAREAAEREREDARKLADRSRAQLAEARELRAHAEEEGRRRAQEELEAFRGELAALRRELARIPRETPDARAAGREALVEAEARARELARRAAPTRPRRARAAAAAPRRISAGDTVLVSSLGSTGRVLSVSNGGAEVQLGAFKSRLPIEDLELREAEAAPAPVVGGSYRVESRPAPSMELDLRGQRAEEVQQQLDRYVDDAYLSGLPTLRIIHGKGGGVLRQVVRDFLRDHPLVESYQPGGAREGGEGVTLAALGNR